MYLINVSSSVKNVSTKFVLDVSSLDEKYFNQMQHSKILIANLIDQYAHKQ
jgi:hypothetical protein